MKSRGPSHFSCPFFSVLYLLSGNSLSFIKLDAPLNDRNPADKRGLGVGVVHVDSNTILFGECQCVRRLGGEVVRLFVGYRPSDRLS